MYILYLCMINYLMILIGGLFIVSGLLIYDIINLKKRITAQEKLLDECIHVTADLINRHNELAEIIAQAMEDAKADMELEEILHSNIIFNPNSIGQA
jgi:hypothetical protein